MAALRAAISVFGNVPQERDSQSVRYGLDGSRCGDASKSTERREGLKALSYDYVQIPLAGVIVATARARYC